METAPDRSRLDSIRPDPGHPVVHAAVLAHGDRTDALSMVLDQLELFGLQRIVVVANAVSPETLAELRRRSSGGSTQYDIRQTQSNVGSAGGYALALQAAFSVADCAMVWLLDDDNLPAPDAYEALLRAHRVASSENENVLLACLRESLPEIRDFDPRLWQQPPQPGTCIGFNIANLFDRFRRAKPPAHDSAGLVPLLWSVYGGLLVPRAAVMICGLPDARFFLYGDDIEWTTRMVRNGFRLRLVRDAVVSDLAPPWNAAGRAGSNLVRRVRDLPTARVFYETRNRNWLALNKAGGRLYALNRAIYLMATAMVAVRYRRLDRFRLIRQAIEASERGELGKNLPQ